MLMFMRETGLYYAFTVWVFMGQDQPPTESLGCRIWAKVKPLYMCIKESQLHFSNADLVLGLLINYDELFENLWRGLDDL